MIGVSGWFTANTLSTPGIVSVGTKPELRYGRIKTKKPTVVALSGELAINPKNTESHVITSIYKRRMPIAIIHSIGPAVKRSPINIATITTTKVAMQFRATEASTCPVST